MIRIKFFIFSTHSFKSENIIWQVPIHTILWNGLRYFLPKGSQLISGVGRNSNLIFIFIKIFPFYLS
ncbi:MAG: hypothetical protein D8M26_16185 [Ignavibacteriae bacterium]|nr:MAG: hypothetical protein EDM72_09780 [Chlorobiota bacterium]MBL1124411.1 hypothetical protein [Ignavibacteriota bacterium]